MHLHVWYKVKSERQLIVGLLRLLQLDFPFPLTACKPAFIFKMRLPLYILLFVGAAHAQDHGEEGSKEMGPVAFLWPPDRTWGAAYDNTAPCGSNEIASESNRTDFPMRECCSGAL